MVLLTAYIIFTAVKMTFFCKKVRHHQIAISCFPFSQAKISQNGPKTLLIPFCPLEVNFTPKNTAKRSDPTSLNLC